MLAKSMHKPRNPGACHLEQNVVSVCKLLSTTGKETSRQLHFRGANFNYFHCHHALQEPVTLLSRSTARKGGSLLRNVVLLAESQWNIDPLHSKCSHWLFLAPSFAAWASWLQLITVCNKATSYLVTCVSILFEY